MNFLVDSNVILDIVTQDPVWFEWSSLAIERCANKGILCINQVIYAEVSIGFSSIEELDNVLSNLYFRRLDLPWEAAFLAGKCFLQYRRHNGKKMAPLPDFYIGAHAAIAKIPLITRDENRYKTYFPTLTLIGPDKN